MSHIFTEEYICDSIILNNNKEHIEVVSGSSILDNVDEMNNYIINSLNDVNMTSFSNSYKTNFIVDGIKFDSIDQYMLYKIIESDLNTVRVISKSDILERVLKNDDSIFIKYALNSLKISDHFLEKFDDILYMGLIAKYENENLKKSLLLTDNFYIDVKDDKVYDLLFSHNLNFNSFKLRKNRTGALLMILRNFL